LPSIVALAVLAVAVPKDVLSSAAKLSAAVPVAEGVSSAFGAAVSAALPLICRLNTAAKGLPEWPAAPPLAGLLFPTEAAPDAVATAAIGLAGLAGTVRAGIRSSSIMNLLVKDARAVPPEMIV
jgi:hypothetical protein